MRRRKYLSFILAGLLLILVCVNVSAEVNNNASTAQNDFKLSAIASIPVGSGPNRVQVLTDVEGDTPQGPQSLSVYNDGRVYLLDSVQSQILVLNNGSVEKSISIPFALYPRDILVYKNEIYILDSNAFIFKTDLNGDLIQKYKLPDGMGSLRVYRLLVDNGEVVLWSENYVEIPLNNMPSKYEISESGKDVILTDSKGISSIKESRIQAKCISNMKTELKSSDGVTTIPIETTQAFGSAMVSAFDKNQNTYVLVEELADPCPMVATEVTLKCYDKKGSLSGVAKLPIEDFDSYPNRPIDVTNDGKIFLLVPSKENVTIYSVELGKSYTSNLVKTRDELNKKAKEEMGMTAFATYIGNPLSRATTRDRCRQMANYSWYWNPTKFDYLPNGTFRPSDAPRPAQLSASSSFYTTGIPYLFGGWDSLWSKTDGSPWTNFGGSLTYYSNKGPLVGDCSSAGSIYTGGQGAGIDCSGFVSAAVWTYSFSGSKPGTGDIYNNALSVTDVVGSNGTWISYSGLQPMDVFVKSGDHVLNYDYRKLDGTGIYTYESTVGYGNLGSENTQGAKQYARRWTELYVNSSNYYTHKTWWSKQTGDDFNSTFTTTGSYSSIRGQMQYFRFTYNGSVSSTVSISTSPTSSSDVDLYIYNTSYNLIGKSEHGVGQTDTVSWTAVPGTSYYAVVHGYYDSNSYTISKSW